MKPSMKRNNHTVAEISSKLSDAVPKEGTTVEKSRQINARCGYRQFRDAYVDLTSPQLPETKTLRRLNYSFFDIPKEFCKTPFYCQKKLRLIQKTFKKNVASTLRATGLEVAAQYYLDKVDRRSAASLRKSIADLGTLEKVKEPLDWELEPQCIFCASEAADKLLQATFPAILGFPTARLDIPMNGSLPSDSDEPTDLSIAKHHRVVKEDQTSSSLKPGKDFPNHRRDRFLLGKNILNDKTTLHSEKVALQRSSKQSRRTPVREPKSKRGAGIHHSISVKADADITDCDKHLSNSAERIRSKPVKEPVRELKRAASKDLTSALKQIINRHISEKTKAELKNEDQDSNNALRNKRGRYRRYDKGDLDEALKAVKNGDMTVHRAGHLFGIPHSTLEYKIKERNILSKRSPDHEKRSSIPSEDPTAPTSATDPSTSQPIKSEPSTPSTPLSALSPIYLQLPSLSPFSWSPSMDSIIPNLSFGFNPTFFPNAFCRNIFGTTPFFSPTPSTTLPFRPWICSMATTPPIKSEPVEETTTNVEVVVEITEDALLDLIFKQSPNSS